MPPSTPTPTEEPERGAFVTAEIASQPQVWRQAADLAAASAAVLPQPDERVAVVGCGTSAFIAQAYAAQREQSALAADLPAGLESFEQFVFLGRGTSLARSC